MDGDAHAQSRRRKPADNSSDPVPPLRPPPPPLRPSASQVEKPRAEPLGMAAEHGTALERLALLREQVACRLIQPRVQPPAWQQLLLTLYNDFPSPLLTSEQREAEVLAVCEAAPMSPAVLRCLRRALVLYHPDKNRPDEMGTEWAAIAEEVTKMGTEIIAYYRQRISASSSELIGPHAER